MISYEVMQCEGRKNKNSYRIIYIHISSKTSIHVRTCKTSLRVCEL